MGHIANDAFEKFRYQFNAFAADFVLLDQKSYGVLRNFFEVVRTADEEQIVLQPTVATASN